MNKRFLVYFVSCLIFVCCFGFVRGVTEKERKAFIDFKVELGRLESADDKSLEKAKRLVGAFGVNNKFEDDKQIYPIMRVLISFFAAEDKARACYLKLFKWMVDEKGAKINVQNSLGHTPLHLIFLLLFRLSDEEKQRVLNYAKYLIADKRARLLIKNQFGKTAIDVCKQRKICRDPMEDFLKQWPEARSKKTEKGKK